MPVLKIRGKGLLPPRAHRCLRTGELISGTRSVPHPDLAADPDLETAARTGLCVLVVLGPALFRICL